ncbi:hypothetical protein GQ457_17G018120 [Hibiscus cannabinus]
MVEPPKNSSEPPVSPPEPESKNTNLEDRVTRLETSITETNGYLQRILDVMQKTREAVELPSPQSVRQKAPQHADAPAKKPLVVTIIDEHEKYSFQPNDPGVLASKPIPAGTSEKHPGEPSFNNTHNLQERNSQQFIPRPKIELQFFDGDNPRSWVRKCEKFFSIFAVPEVNKVEVASMYLIGKAETWFDGYIMQKNHLSWQEFVSDMTHRFTDKLHTDVIEEFNKIHQTSTVEEYQERFEALQPFMLQINAQLGESYFISSFISGLKDTIRHKVRVHEPQTLADACRKAKIYELAMEIEDKKPRFTYKSPYQSSPTSLKAVPLQTHAQLKNQTAAATPKQSLLDFRRSNNLCFKCGDKFNPGHQCKLKQLHMMEELEPSAETEDRDFTEIQQHVDTPKEETTEQLEISINALTGCVGSSTIRIPGTIRGKFLSILIDTGSTHSFITPGWAKEGLELIHTHPLSITVANGEKLLSTAISKKLVWQMQGHSFEHDFRVLHLGGSDMDITLQGGNSPAALKIISGEKMQKLTAKDPHFFGELYFLSVDSQQSNTPEYLQPLLDRFHTVFEEPKGLPPPRSHDHAISLLPGAQPVNLRPYRFPFSQKTEVEKQISEMLAASIIQTSKSPFASPCLLVKKKDGTWRLCVDYRQLNSLTVKNKYPIPVVDDLLDELSGAKYYSKLDLRSSYWQIRIHPADVPKTAFRTHHGHFEFKVMPFGLTNAPATFQSLMNEIFAPYLRKFVLVFFDDILIYSLSMTDHYFHLQQVLQILKDNQLFARRSKCFFGQERVEYLGHIISQEGVATDPSKVEAMRNWQFPKTLKSLRGFLGLTGYYRKFIRNYGSISKPLTLMLKKDNFVWTTEAKEAFLSLKNAMCAAPAFASAWHTQHGGEVSAPQHEYHHPPKVAPIPPRAWMNF